MRWIWDSLDLDMRGAVDRMHWVGITESVCAGYGTTVGHLFSKSKKSKLPPIFHQVLASISRGLSFVRYELLASGTQALSPEQPHHA